MLQKASFQNFARQFHPPTLAVQQNLNRVHVAHNNQLLQTILALQHSNQLHQTTAVMRSAAHLALRTMGTGIVFVSAVFVCPDNHKTFSNVSELSDHADQSFESGLD